MLMGGLPVEELQAQAFRTLLSSGGMGGGLFAEAVAPRLSGLPDWDRDPGLPAPFGAGTDGSSAAMHEFHCDVSLLWSPGPCCVSAAPVICSVSLERTAMHQIVHCLGRQLGCAWLPPCSQILVVWERCMLVDPCILHLHIDSLHCVSLNTGHWRELVSIWSRLLTQVCRVTCCGMTNFQQHCNSKKHLRKAAAAGAAAISDLGSPGCPDSLADDPAEGLQSANPTYVGLQAQCRNYCKQVGTRPLLASTFRCPHLDSPTVPHLASKFGYDG